ncbi:MAG TPA: photosynthetic reaction center cytochrome PufC [Myxococcaceae bacterium]|nr:photosynthetic reaction center cytochrome PufC [Myxococcaceae bacterium]
MRGRILAVLGVVVGVLLMLALVNAFRATSAVQTGFRGVGMEQVDFNTRLEAKLAANTVPDPIPAAGEGGELAAYAYQNVQVLGHLSSGEFTRLMAAITTWVAPEVGCVYCHAPQRDDKGQIMKDEDGYVIADPNKMDSDETYQKRVARRMIQMTLHLNGDWKDHLKETGVTCYTCHRGQPVPANLWFDPPPDPMADRLVGSSAGQNHPNAAAGVSSLPVDPFRPFLVSDEQIRVIATAALPGTDRQSIKQAEWSYSLMMHMSSALGVNCTYCHNSRSFGAWDASPPPRAQAWFGIRMVRDINKNYLEPLAGTFPENRLGPNGDVPKAHCGTCHAGAYKPLLGVSMLKDYQVLARAQPQPPPRPPEQGAASTPAQEPTPAR